MSKLQHTVNKIVDEEVKALIREAKERAPALDKKLEEMRKKLMPDMTTQEGMSRVAADPRPQRRIELTNCADILGVKVNELTLHFLNNVKTKNERSLVEMHLGHVYFYGD